jgi:DNA-binding response OmpR family regulator
MTSRSNELTVNSKPIRILFIEHNNELIDALQEGLVLSGHNIESIDSPEALPEVSRDGSFDVFIIHLQTQEVMAQQLIERLRNIYPDSGILFLTANIDNASLSQLYRDGLDMCLTLPSPNSLLFAAIDSLIRRLGRQSQPEGLIVNVNAYAIYDATNQLLVRLTTTELALLIGFASAPQQKLEFWQLTELLKLNIDQDCKHAIELHISRLRTKLIQALGDKKYIRSIRGWGYHFTEPLTIVQKLSESVR